MIEVEWWDFDTAAELAEQAAGDIGFVVESAIEAHGGARIAIGAGPTMAPVYKALSKLKLDWSKVTLIATDERLVPAGDSLSNHRAMEEAFGKSGATLVPLVEDASLEYREAGRRADERLASLAWPLDLVCLAAGQDGEIAGILPGPDMDRAITGPRGRRAVGLHPNPLPEDAPVDRVTLTADAITTARAIMVIVRGDEARATVERAIEEGPLSSHPTGRVLAGLDDTSVDILWSAE